MGKITVEEAKKFMRSIITRYGILYWIITDNGSQFRSGIFTMFCEEFGIKTCFASVAHPQSNSQVKRANVIVLQGIKTQGFDRFKAYSKCWVKELPSVLLVVRTLTNRATDETTFFLVYGAEAVLPTELQFGSPQVESYSKKGKSSYEWTISIYS